MSRSARACIGALNVHRDQVFKGVIGHVRSEHRIGRNGLWHREAMPSNVVLAAVGYNFRGLSHSVTKRKIQASLFDQTLIDQT